MVLVPVTGIINSKAGNTREYPGNWNKGSTSAAVRFERETNFGIMARISQIPGTSIPGILLIPVLLKYKIVQR